MIYMKSRQHEMVMAPLQICGNLFNVIDADESFLKLQKSIFPSACLLFRHHLDR